MNSFVLFGDGAIPPPKKKDGNFASCATRDDAVFRHFFSSDIPSLNKKINLFLNSYVQCKIKI
jgi:hypothetical protein